MRIAQVSPLHESVPPRLYGGTERVVAYLTEELVRRGHDVTLFASGDSRTRARLVPGCGRALRLAPECVDGMARHIAMLELVFREAQRFDVIHFHTDYVHLPAATRLGVPHVTTLHGRLDIPDLAPLYAIFRDAPLVSISDAQRRPLAGARWAGTIHHGLPPRLYRPRFRPGRYLAFLGRISVEKRPDRAIAIARESGLPLRIAAKVDRPDRRYFEERIAPLLSPPRVTFLGEIAEPEKNDFLAHARALLFPIDWPEPFGLVLIEAMACGTPVVAFPGGAVPEIVEDGVTGYIVRDRNEAVRAVARAGALDRIRIRRRFEERFTVGRMTEAYVDLYRRLARPYAVAAGVSGAE